MKQILSYTLTFIMVTLSLITKGQTASDRKARLDSTKIESVEKGIQYSSALDPNQLNYKLSHSPSGKLKITFINQPVGNITIKIYDILGNVIVTESPTMIHHEIEYQTDGLNKIYVVKIESATDQLIKRIHF